MKKLVLNKPVLRSFSTLLLGAALLGGCSSLLSPADVSPPALYSFDNAQPLAQDARPAKIEAPTLVLSTPRAAAGFDSQHMIYIRQAHKLEYFRQSQWVNTPANMLSPLVAVAMERSGAFGAVVQSSTSVNAKFRLDLEVVRLQHEFLSSPSRVHFTLRAHLLDTATQQVIAWHEFDTLVPAKSDDPYGGVMAANQAVRDVIEQLTTFCSDAITRLPSMRP